MCGWNGSWELTREPQLAEQAREKGLVERVSTSEYWSGVGSSDKMSSTGEESGNPFQYSRLENPMNSVKRQQSMGSQRVGHNLATKQQQSE